MTYERERERTEFGVLETGLALVVDVPRNTNINITFLLIVMIVQKKSIVKELKASEQSFGLDSNQTYVMYAWHSFTS